MIKKYLAILLCFTYCINLHASDSSTFKTEIEIPKIHLVDSTSYIPDTLVVHPSILYMPIIFQKQQVIYDTIEVKPFQPSDTLRKEFAFDNKWLKKELENTHFENYHINRIIYQTPEIVKYNINMLPEPPKQYVIVVKPNKVTLSLEEMKKERPTDKPDSPEIKYKSWINTLNSSVQFSQAYLSENWYQGGNSNLNLYGNFVYNLKLNQNLHPNLLFENSIQYKISLSSAPQDSLRDYSISEDLFQINTKFGIKAANKWYYTTTLMFKTQLFNNYTVNTTKMKAAFLTPGELNFGFGMTYNTTNKRKNVNFNVSLAPISYNMKICMKTDDVDPTIYGIDEGRHIANQIGSNIEAKFGWIITPNITFNSRLFVFTDYAYIQGDWESTFNFSINKYLSTQLYFHFRYDTSTTSDPSWKKWQFKEILSFGFNYRI